MVNEQTERCIRMLRVWLHLKNDLCQHEEAGILLPLGKIIDFEEGECHPEELLYFERLRKLRII